MTGRPGMLQSMGLQRIRHDLATEQHSGGALVKNLPANAGDATDASLIPGSGRSPEGEHNNPLQYSYLENPMDRRAWQATVHGF